MVYYSAYVPMGPTEGEKQKANEEQKQRTELIAQYVKTNGLTRLECNYFGMDNYYYNHETKTMYKVNVLCPSKYSKHEASPIFEVSHDAHILELNHLL